LKWQNQADMAFSELKKYEEIAKFISGTEFNDLISQIILFISSRVERVENFGIRNQPRNGFRRVQDQIR